MSRWFRMYDELLDDPKVQRLSSDDFKGWVNLLCLASRNNGRLPAIADVAFALRLDDNGALTLVERLRNGGLIEKRNGGANGSFYAPNKWDERQYKSDTSTERVKRFRQRSKPVAGTAPDTEAETEVPLSKDNGLIDPEKAMFDGAIRLIVASGKGEAQARTVAGKWKRDYPTADVIAALGMAQREGAIEPIAFVERCLKGKATTYDRDRITV